MKSKGKKIFYTFVQKRSFIDTDIRYLSTHFDLTVFLFTSTPKWMIPISFIGQFFHLLFLGWRYDYIISFFAGFHSVLPAWFAKLTGKKCIIFLAGTDAFNYPSFHYGNFTRKAYGKATCISAHAASILVPVSSNLVLKSSPYYKEDSIIQGIYHWCKDLKTPYEVIPFEYNVDLFKRQPVARKENSFITVAFGIQGTSFIRKGIDKMLMIASHFPQYEFTIVGYAPSEFPVPVPANVTLVPPVPHAKVPEYLSAHQYFLQLSIAEGFPSAIVEAMLCECIPIGSEVAAIPEIVSTHGFLVPERDDEIILDTVRKAIAYKDKEALGKSAREYIVTHFGPGRRTNALLKLLD
jgi:glycosyltransferase involved in cell wall biosynthesis